MDDPLGEVDVPPAERSQLPQTQSGECRHCEDRGVLFGLGLGAEQPDLGGGEHQEVPRPRWGWRSTPSTGLDDKPYTRIARFFLFYFFLYFFVFSLFLLVSIFLSFFSLILPYISFYSYYNYNFFYLFLYFKYYLFLYFILKNIKHKQTSVVHKTSYYFLLSSITTPNSTTRAPQYSPNPYTPNPAPTSSNSRSTHRSAFSCILCIKAVLLRYILVCDALKNPSHLPSVHQHLRAPAPLIQFQQLNSLSIRSSLLSRAPRSLLLPGAHYQSKYTSSSQLPHSPLRSLRTAHVYLISSSAF